MSTSQNGLVRIPYEPWPTLGPADKRPATAEDLKGREHIKPFLKPRQVPLVIRDKARIYIDVGLRSSVSVALLSLGPNEIWHVLAKIEDKAFGDMVNTMPGGYFDDQDRNKASKAGRRLFGTETGKPLSEINLWKPEGRDDPLINLGGGRMYPNSTPAVQENLMAIHLGGDIFIPESRDDVDEWAFIPAFPSDDSDEAEEEWNAAFDGHGAASHCLLRASRWMQRKGFALSNGKVGPNWTNPTPR